MNFIASYMGRVTLEPLLTLVSETLTMHVTLAYAYRYRRTAKCWLHPHEGRCHAIAHVVGRSRENQES